MNSTAWLLLIVAGLAAAANWLSRWRDHRPTELWSKPLALVGLIGVALAIEPVDPTVRAWFVAALILSLAGDVFLLGSQRWFLAGLGAFLAAHLAYIGGFAVADERRWWALLPAAMAVGLLAATAGRRIVGGARRHDAAMAVPVIAYLSVISAMLLAAAVAGNGWAIGGALAFVVSDTVLGWREFVTRKRWMPLAVMVTYHGAQAALVISLL